MLMSVIVGAACQPLQPVGETQTAGAAQAASQTQASSQIDTTIRTKKTAALPPDSRPVPVWQTDTSQYPNGPVALLLPLSGHQQSAGMAVRDGFIAAHLDSARGRLPQQVLVFDVALLGVTEAHQQAVNAGAGIIVGPLLRESVQALNQTPGMIPVLALNYLPDGEATRTGFWQFGLAPEDETWEIAARAVSLGQLRAISLAPDTSWGRRLQQAFQDNFSALGGQVVGSRLYPAGESDFSPELRAVLAYRDKSPTFDGGRRQDIDLVFLAANNSTGKLIYPQLRFFGAGDLPTYSTSAIWEDGDSNANDLNGISFPDGPWMIAPDSRSALLKSQLARYWGSQSLSLSRLYALGYDAWQLLPAVRRQSIPGPFYDGDIRGVTGTLQADAMGRIHRRLLWATMRGGQPTPAVLPGEFRPVSGEP
jgi:outer membrane PBP1 activator LpoA protein